MWVKASFMDCLKESMTVFLILHALFTVCQTLCSAFLSEAQRPILPSSHSLLPSPLLSVAFSLSWVLQ